MAIVESAPQNNIRSSLPAAQVEGSVINGVRLAVPYLLTEGQVQSAKTSALPYLLDKAISGLLISTPDKSFIQVRIDRPTEGTPAYAEYRQLLVDHRDLTQRALALEHILSRPGSRKNVVEAKLASTKRAISEVTAKLGSNITLINPDGRPFIPDQTPQPFGGVQDIALPQPLATPRSRGRGATGHAGTIAGKSVGKKVAVERKDHVLRNTIAVGIVGFGALTAAIAPTAADITNAIMQPPAPPKTEPVKSAPAIVLPTSTTTPIPTIIPIYTATPSPTPSSTPSPIPSVASAEATRTPSVIPATPTPDISEGTAEDMSPYEVVKQTIGPTIITNDTGKYVTYPQTDQMTASGNFEVRFKLDVKSPGVDTAGANPKNTVTLDLNKGRVYLAKNGTSYVMAVVDSNQAINRVVIGSDKSFPKGEFTLRLLRDSQTAQVIVDGRVVGALDISKINNLFNSTGPFTLGVEAAPKAEDIFSATIAVPKGQEDNIKPFVPTPVPPKPANTPTPRVTPVSQPDNAPYSVFTEMDKFTAITSKYPTIFNSQNGIQLVAPMDLISRGDARKYKPVYPTFNGMAIVNSFDPASRGIDQWRGTFRTGNIVQMLGQGMVGNEPYEQLLVQLQNGQSVIYDMPLSNDAGGILVPAYKSYPGVDSPPSVSVIQTHISMINPKIFEGGDFIAFLETPNSTFITLPNGTLYKRLEKNSYVLIASNNNLYGYLKP